MSRISYDWSLVLGVFASLSPDLDFWVAWGLKRQFPMDHREGKTSVHYPLFFVPLFTAAGLLIDPWLGLIFFLGSSIHFIHDSFGAGWGVKWLYPFSPKEYCWMNKEFKERFKRGSNYSAKIFMKETYLKPNGLVLGEYIVFILGILIAIKR